MHSSRPTDPALLAQWLDHRCEEAFRELVGRYAGLVHGTARRTCGDDATAAEVAQLTFIALSRKAKSLTGCPSLAGWLHRTAILHARNQLRQATRESRKRQALHAAMKITSLAVPLVVLFAVGIWLAGQFRSIAELEDRNARLHRDPAAADPTATVTSRPVATKTALDKKPIDWAEVARQLKLAQSEPNALLRSTARLEAQLSAMSRDELLGALDEIAAATIPDDDRELLEKHLCDDLVGPKGGPRLVLDRFTRRYGEGGWCWTLAVYFEDWIDKEPDQAIAWLRQHAGEMGNPDQLVSQSFFPRLTSDPAIASRILTALPEDKRLESLRTLAARCLSGPEQQVAWAKTFRTELPEKDRLAAVNWPTFAWSDGDGARMSMAEVGAYLDRIQATPAEREACILSAASDLAEAGTFVDRFDSRPAAKKIEALRGWVSTQAPQLLDRATGKGLAGLAGREGGDPMRTWPHWPSATIRPAPATNCSFRC